ncbi:MAG: ABC transporter substrate-binding protein [Steroidobacteraceae bacterium]
MSAIATRATLLLFLFAVSGVASAAGPVSIGVVNWIGYGPLYCAAANDYYRKYGFTVRLVTFSDNSQMSGALQGGEIDASTLTYDQVIVADAKGWKLKVVMPIDYSVGGDAIVATQRVQTVKDLKGRKVAFQPLSPSDFLLSYSLTQAGLSERDIQPVNSTPEGVVAVMATGAVDAGVTYEPSVSMIRKLGGGSQFHVLLSSREARGMITDVLAFKDSTIQKNRRLVEGLMKGTMEGVAFMHREPAKAAAIIARTLGISASEVQAQLPNIENPPLERLGDVFDKAAVLPSFYASGRIIGDILRKQGLIHDLPPIEDTYDATFAAALQAEAGVHP